MLGARLGLLSKELTEQASSLENANRLLQEYEQEEKRTKSRLKRQRNIAYVLAAIAVISLMPFVHEKRGRKFFLPLYTTTIDKEPFCLAHLVKCAIMKWCFHKVKE